MPPADGDVAPSQRDPVVSPGARSRARAERRSARVQGSHGGRTVRPPGPGAARVAAVPLDRYAGQGHEGPEGPSAPPRPAREEPENIRARGGAVPRARPPRRRAAEDVRPPDRPLDRLPDLARVSSSRPDHPCPQT